MTDAIFDRTRAIIERVVGAQRTPAHVDAGTRLADGFWLDSVEMLEVVIACEIEFGIVFSEAGDLDVASLDTVGTLVEVIRARLSSTQAGV